MLLLYYLVFFGNILLISNTVILDSTCTNQTQCNGIGAICHNDKCQCDTPYYTPCGTSDCNPKSKFVYENDACRVDANCLDNANCSKSENRCRCMTGFTAIHGLCYKSLNSTCTNSLECWSSECRDKICKCPLGFIPKDDNKRCQRKLANIYLNWTYANASNDFCYETDSYNGVKETAYQKPAIYSDSPVSCLVPSAICQNDSKHSEKFCQCPLTHIADYNKQECQLKIYNGSSPSITTLPSDECGKCQVDNALCATVSNQTTCWCRAGFIKNENQCVKSRQRFIFPNSNDTTLHNYALNCSMNVTNGLCTCAPGYKFVDKISLCQPIKPEWENENFEYGVCTRIDSNGRSVQEKGLCPEPLTCEARHDKHVCSCGRDRYLDEKTKSCYYFLGKNLTDPDQKFCPLNSILHDNQCQCNLTNIYSVSKDHKTCELNLNETGDNQEKALCNLTNTIGDTVCEELFGGNTKFCRQGECRCILDKSYYENNTCVTLIYANPGMKNICPENAENSSDVCKCKHGYEIENMNNRTCVQKVKQLNETIQNLAWTLTIDDCQALFPNQSVKVANNTCQCIDNAFFNGTICVFYLGITPPVNSSLQCPKNANTKLGYCSCDPGYKEMNNTTCDSWAMNIFQHNETTVSENLIGIKDDDCKILFGSAAEISENNKFCRCQNESIAFWDDNKCYFLVDTIVNDSACPPNSTKNVDRCECIPGYQSTKNKKGCEQKPIHSSNLQSINGEMFREPCNNMYTDEDCVVFYGTGAICRNNTCYCDRSRSFVRNNRCELFSQYIFPGRHEYHLYTCNSQDDCGNTDVEKNSIECNFFNENYRVCQCKKDYFFNPIDSTCVQNQCFPQCSNTEECQNYTCICKNGYYRDSSGQCVKLDMIFKLYDKCNETYWSTSNNDELECSFDCERVRCSSNYHDADGSKCVKNSFEGRCAHNINLCSNLSPGSQCDINENKCTCLSGYYQTEGSIICARAVGHSCIDSFECGDFGNCINETCTCKIGRIEKEVLDIIGRKIKTCIKAVSSVDQIRFNPIFLLFSIIIVCVFFP